MKKKLTLLCAALLAVISFSFSGCALKGGEADQPYGVATCSVAICEILDALDCDDVVGIPTTGSDIPERYHEARKIGAPMEPQMEILKQVNPEVVLVPITLQASLDAEFKAAKINVKYVNLSDVEGMYDDILEIGKLIGKEEAAEALYSEYTTYVESYPKSAKQPTVMTVMAFASLFTIAAEDSYVGNLVKIAGGKNVYPTGYVTDGTGMITNYSLEDMAQKDPDIIIVYAHFNEDLAFDYIRGLTKTDAVWKNFRAVKDKQIFYLSNQYGFGVSANLAWRDALEALKPIFCEE